MANVMIIGNGFDLYHSLPTRYSDFLFMVQNWNTFYDLYKESQAKEKSVDFIDIPLNKGKLSLRSLESFARHKFIFNEDNIEYLNSHIKNNYWIKYFLGNSLKGEQWIDFENEINNILQAVDSFFENIPEHAKTKNALAASTVINSDVRIKMQLLLELINNQFACDYKGILSDYQVEGSQLKKHKLFLIENLTNELYELIECLRLYFLEFVERINCDTYSEQIKELGDVNLLSFNYTNIFGRLYAQKNYHFIHGNCSCKNMVLGISDDSFGDNKLEYIYFLKYFQRIQKRTGNLYKSWNRKITTKDNDTYMEGSPFKVYIMGHSLAEADKGILKDFFINKNVEQINIFYHNQDSYEKMLINLVKMFGKDFLISKTGVGKIVFTELRKAAKIESQLQ